MSNPARIAPGTASRYDTIDLLRGLSILAVILLHARIRFNGGEPPVVWALPPWLNKLLLGNGGNGVTMFFAVSGFLITTTSIRRFGSLAQMQVARFYRIRFARIAPLLLTLLAVLSVLHLCHVDGFVISAKKGETLPRALLAAVTFRLNWYEAAHGWMPANWGVMWSLSVEEMFYLFFPLLCVGLLRWRRGMWAFLAVLLGFVMVQPFSQALWTRGTGIWEQSSDLNGMGDIALGVLTALLVAWVQKRGNLPRRVTLIALEAAGAVLIGWTWLCPSYWHWLRPTMRLLGHSGTDDTVLSLGTCLVMFATVLLGTRGARVLAPLRWLGRHSYEVYLTHEFVVIGMTEVYFKWSRGPLGLWFAAIVLLAALLGWVVARFLSEPANRWLRRTRKPALRLS